MEAVLSRIRPLFRTPGAIARDTLTNIWDDDVAFYAAGIAFHSLFSIFALLFFLSLVLGLFGADPDKLHVLSRFVDGFAPEKAQEFVDNVIGLVSRPVPTALIPVALVFTLWTASNVFQAVIHALNRIYHLREDTRPAWRTRLMALGVVGAGSSLFVLGVVLLVFGQDLSSGFENLRQSLIVGILAARKMLALAAVFLASWWLYWLAPDFKHEERVAWPGAMFFTGAWVLVTLMFNLYIREFAVYDRVYGPLATVVVMLVWVYLTAFLSLSGGELNAALQRARIRRRAESG